MTDRVEPAETPDSDEVALDPTDTLEGRENEAQARTRPLQRPPKKMKKPGAIKKGQRRLEAQQKARLALEGRKAGLTYQAIAERVGYANATSARNAVMRAFSQIIQEPVAELKTLQIERLNHMLVALWPKAQAGDERAIATALAVMDKIDRLEGTEAASKSEIKHTGAVLVVDGSKDDYISAMKQMAGIAENGTNLTATQVPELDAGPTTGTTGGGSMTVTYPAGMVPSTHAQAVEDVVDAELVEDRVEPGQTAVRDAETERDTSSTGNVGKTYRFGVDPITHKKESA